MNPNGAPPGQAQGEIAELFDLARDLLCIAGFDGYLKRVNEEYVRVLGYSRSTLLNQTYYDIVHPDDHQSVTDALSVLATGTDLIGYEHRMLCADGSVIWVQWSTRTMPDRGYVFAAARDVTTQRRAEEELRAVAVEQAALRRVATLVADHAPPPVVFDAVAEEAGRVLAVDDVRMLRYEDNDHVRVITSWGEAGGGAPVGTRLPIAGEPIARLVRDIRRPARIADDRGLPDARHGSRETERTEIGSPIFVGGRLWGVTVAATSRRDLPPTSEGRLGSFTDLVATAVANADARADVERLAEEQAALRRVAEMVARGDEPEEVFAMVVREVSELLDVGLTGLVRLNGDGSTALVALHNAPSSVAAGERWQEPGDDLIRRVIRSARPVRLDDSEPAVGTFAPGGELGPRSRAGAPVLVESRLWGVIVGLADSALPSGTEHRLADFAELIGMAIFAAQARASQRALAEEQTALRRVAEMVARGVAPDQVFESVAAEASRLLGDEQTVLLRFEDDGAATVAAPRGGSLTVGSRIPVLPGTLEKRVRRTARPARIDEPGGGVAAPITVDGRIWGTLRATSVQGAFPAETEHRLSQFAELVAAAVANTESREQLRASRARVIATADEARRRIQRDVHDGAQQRLVQTVMALNLMRRTFDDGDVERRRELLEEALLHGERAITELRDTVHGILPGALTRRGLQAGVESLILDLPVRVELAITVPRLEPSLETTAYFVIAEALTNVVKHARAEVASVDAGLSDGALRLEVRDDGIGGADAGRGTGITGLFDRVAAADGSIAVESPAGAGTVVRVTLPLPAVDE